MKHCCNVLCASMVKFCKNNANVAPPQEVFMTIPPLEAKALALHRICTMLGAYLSQTPSAPPPTAHTVQVQVIHQPNPQDTVKAIAPKDIYGISTTELSNTLKFCSLEEGNHNSLLSWLKQISEKHQNENT
eukprot:15354021-Ditylum_brightwellii.AAC.1